MISPNAQGGDVVINTTESVTLDTSYINNGSDEDGNGGELSITTPNLTLTNGAVINNTKSGKGGVPPTPEEPLTSQNLTINGEITSASAIPEPIKTSRGKIQLARGIKFTEDGRIILTAYRTNNAGERLPAGRINCGQI
ncbi:MAG: hypothetical protein ACRC2S_24445 [Waterburya sp.]